MRPNEHKKKRSAQYKKDHGIKDKDQKQGKKTKGDEKSNVSKAQAKVTKESTKDAPSQQKPSQSHISSRTYEVRQVSVRRGKLCNVNVTARVS